MSCEFFHDHFTSAGNPDTFAAHRRECAECRRLSEGFIRMDALLSRLSPPAVPPGAWERWKSVAATALDCDNAAELLARRMEDELPAADRRRIELHLSRCAPCREASDTLDTLGILRAPEPSGKTPARPPRVVSLAAERARRGARERALLDPRLYAAAACLLAGFFAFFANSVTGSTRSDLAAAVQRQVRVRAAEAADRLKIWEDSASRRFVATREAVSGYGKAVQGIALAAAGRVTGEALQAAAKFERGRKS